MFVYEKRLEYPIKIANTDPRLAAIIIRNMAVQTGSLALPSGI